MAIHDKGVEWKVQKQTKADKYRIGCRIGKARNIDEHTFAVAEDDNPGILIIEMENEKHGYYCDSWGQYWDKVSNKKLEKKLVEDDGSTR